MLPALATTADAALFGLTVTDAALLRASTRVRAHTGQRVSSGTSTVSVYGPSVYLPERPVVSVDTVVDADGVAVSSDDWTLVGQRLSLPTTGRFTVTYQHGWATIPDAVVEVVCTVAARLVAAATDAAIAQGVVQEQSGSVSQTYGADAWRGLSGLTAEEKAVLARVFPRVPRTLVGRA